MRSNTLRHLLKSVWLVFLPWALWGCTEHCSAVAFAQTASPACPLSPKCTDWYCQQALISGGVFRMGSFQPGRAKAPDYFGGLETFGDPRPPHDVYVEPYCIDVYEVTVARYEQCVHEGACDPGDMERSLAPSAPDYHTKVSDYPDKCHNHGEECPNYPVNCRSYEQAEAYCKWIGRRLCTEAEWERAASGPGSQKNTYPWGFEPPDDTRANTWPRGPGHLTPVDAYPDGISAEGIYNLAGNVYEWVSDWYAPYGSADRGPSLDSGGPKTGQLRVGRGGCFLTPSSYRVTERTTLNPQYNYGCVGIRCCADATPPQ